MSVNAFDLFLTIKHTYSFVSCGETSYSVETRLARIPISAQLTPFVFFNVINKYPESQSFEISSIQASDIASRGKECLCTSCFKSKFLSEYHLNSIGTQLFHRGYHEMVHLIEPIQKIWRNQINRTEYYRSPGVGSCFV